MIKLSRILTTATALFTMLAGPMLANAGMPAGHAVVGVDVGYHSRSGDLESHYFATPLNPLGVPAGTAVASTTNKLSDSGTSIGLLAGYQWWCRDMFLGLEGHVDWGRYEKAKFFHFLTSTPAGVNVSGQATYTQDTRYGITTRFGMKVPPFFMPYVRAGVEYSKHEVSLANIIFSANPPPYDHFSESHRMWSWLVGAGVEVPLFSKNVTIRAEYNYYPGRHFGFNENFDILGGNHDIKVRTHTGKLALVWNFI